MNSPTKLARTVALLMLLIVVLAPFTMIYVPSVVIVAGDATATANRVMASEGLFRLGLAGDLLVVLLEVAITALLYRLFKPVNPSLSLMAAFARLGMTVIQGVNLLNHLAVLLLLSGATYLAVFTPAQVHALALFFLEAHTQVVLVWGLLFAFHLTLLGLLVYRSNVVPRWVGVLLGVASACYWIQGFGTLLLPESKALFTSIGLLSAVEIVFPLWFLIKGWTPRPVGVDHDSSAS